MLALKSQSGPESDGNEEVLHIPQNSSITRASPSDCLVSNPGPLDRTLSDATTLGLSEPGNIAEMQSVYSAAPANWAK